MKLTYRYMTLTKDVENTKRDRRTRRGPESVDVFKAGSLWRVFEGDDGSRAMYYGPVRSYGNTVPRNFPVFQELRDAMVDREPTMEELLEDRSLYGWEVLEKLPRELVLKAVEELNDELQAGVE